MNTDGKSSQSALNEDSKKLVVFFSHLLRWQLQSGNIAIPGSTNAAHIAEDFDIFDFELTSDDMKRIDDLDQNHRFASY